MTATAKPATSAPATSAPATPTSQDWTKPAAMAIPKEGYFKLEQGRYGPIYPEDPRLLRLHHHREDQARHGGGHPRVRQRRSRRRSPGCPTASPCSSCTTCAGCSSTSARTPTSCIRASSTPTSTSTPRTPSRSSRKYGHQHGLREPRRLPRGLEDEHAGVHQVRPGAPAPELPGVRRVPVCERGRDQEGAEAQGGVLRHARPDAVIAGRAPCSNWTTSSTSC